ncbi:uncharacterized protein LOC121930079 isoform X2 [Sceloporus undulatus]|uniref:uncharacterized protein LOC121930079 isoform X2 n=1 Tax=Sceloporus undulatus TaxID=8520 RepID=UPI001C4AF6B5|nr:uncharacterized protein LOC121930079 isoform X2 [Sceloporus undulatus]
MDAEQAAQEMHVQAAVGIRQLAGSVKQESFVVVNEDSNRLIFINKAKKGVQEGCFTINGVFNLDTGQVIESVFQESSSPSNNAQFLKTISFVQIYSDGQAQDLLSPKSQVLRVMDLPPLGLVVEEATEIIVTDSQAATHFYRCGVSAYQRCFQQPFPKPQSATCGILFTITIETKVAEGQGLQRATVRIFEFLGANEQPCTDPFLPLSWALSAVPLPPEAGFLPWILKRLLEDNTLTFLLLCLTLPDASGEEILSAISLTEQVRTVTKRVAPTHWDPTQEAQKRRAAIGELRAQLFLSDQAEQGRIIIQLEKVIKELQVLKSQNWEKKEKSADEIKEGDTFLAARVQISSDIYDREKFGNHPKSQQKQNDLHQQKEIKDGRIRNIQFGQVGGQEEATKDHHFTKEAYNHRDLILDGTTHAQSPNWAGEQHQGIKERFSLAKVKRQHLQKQHKLLIQQEILRVEKELEGQEKISPAQQEPLLWQKEKPLFTLCMDTLQREQAEAEKDLEELYQECQHEIQTQKQHFLQVFQAFKRHAEEQMDALERQYRKLLKESLRDAIILSAHNQQLQAEKQLAFRETATQTDFQTLKQKDKSHSTT